MKNKKNKFSIVIPIYNEEKSIAKIIKKVKSVKYPGTIEIIAVDDFSQDKTKDVLEKINGIKKFYNEKNYGKGYSIRKGFREATGDIILIQDADLEYNPQDHLKLIEKFKDKKINVVFGSRFLNTKPIARYRLFYMGNIFLSLITRILYSQQITDMETCYKSFRKKTIDKIKLSENRFGIEPEITCKLIRMGNKIHEVPISYKSRSYDEGKKIGVKDGIYAVYLLFKYKFIN